MKTVTDATNALLAASIRHRMNSTPATNDQEEIYFGAALVEEWIEWLDQKK